MTPDNHNSKICEPSDFLINPVECASGVHNFIVNDENLALWLAQSFDCDIISCFRDFDLYN